MLLQCESIKLRESSLLSISMNFFVVGGGSTSNPGCAKLSVKIASTIIPPSSTLK